MKHLLFLSAIILSVSTCVASNLVTEIFTDNLGHNPNHPKDISTLVDVQDIYVIELEESIDLGFDVNQYLPSNFNPLKGKDDIDWNTITLIEIPENESLGFDHTVLLPKDFNPLKGKDDLNWDVIPLIDIEEPFQFDFDINDYLPKGFNPNI
ncbi:hypothetical protein SAMN04487989_106160 [Bizionia echini]|uniref:Uncharacterized protein n=1 Tax=Bizionia echini TaxID=649333 RepID=A0A1I5D1H4_9FLAO|nr:hypothetical protein SAMN04487989_106160 [Bizionia echini]